MKVPIQSHGLMRVLCIDNLINKVQIADRTKFPNVHLLWKVKYPTNRVLSFNQNQNPMRRVCCDGWSISEGYSGCYEIEGGCLSDRHFVVYCTGSDCKGPFDY